MEQKNLIKVIAFVVLVVFAIKVSVFDNNENNEEKELDNSRFDYELQDSFYTYFQNTLNLYCENTDLFIEKITNNLSNSKYSYNGFVNDYNKLIYEVKKSVGDLYSIEYPSSMNSEIEELCRKSVTNKINYYNSIVFALKYSEKILGGGNDKNKLAAYQLRVSGEVNSANEDLQSHKESLAEVRQMLNAHKNH